MAHVLVMPRQGNTVESCVILKWIRKEGDAVASSDTVCEVETDKAAFEVAAGADGTLLKILRPEGDDVPVLEAIAVIGKPGEQVDTAVLSGAAGNVPGSASSGTPLDAARPGAIAGGPSSGSTTEERRANDAPTAEGRPERARDGAPAGVSPRARNLAAGNALDPETLAGSGPGGRVIERDVVAALENRPGLTAAARDAVASGAGSLPAEGSGLGGRVRLGDLEHAGTERSPEVRPGAAAARPARFASEDFPGPVVDTPLKGIRKTIADRMRSSLATTAQFTLSMSAKADRLFELRRRFKESAPEHGLRDVTINDLVVYAALRTLEAFPFMNAHKAGDVIRTFERVHLGLAVDTPRGLMVPVIRNASLLGLRELSSEAKRLGEACRTNKVRPDELSGSTFTVTNLGGTGVETFTPVLNAPEAAILGVCAIRNEAVPDEKAGFRFERKIGLSLTIDHQAVDGAPAARFLKALCETIADIDLSLMR